MSNRNVDYTDVEYMTDEEYVAMIQARQDNRQVNLGDYFSELDTVKTKTRTKTNTTTTKEPAPKIPYVSVELSDDATTFLYSCIDDAREWIIALMGSYDISDKGINFVVEDFVLPMQVRTGGSVEMIKFDVAEKLYEKQQEKPELLYLGIAHLHPRNMSAFFSSTDNDEVDSQKAMLPIGFSIVFSPFQKKFISSESSYEPIEYALKAWVNKTVINIEKDECMLGDVDRDMLEYHSGMLAHTDSLTEIHLNEKEKLIIGKELLLGREYMSDFTLIQAFAAREYINNNLTEEDIVKITTLYREALKKKVVEDAR